MSRPRFLADQDLRRAIVLGARRLEPALEFRTGADLGLSAATDEHLLEFAEANNWLLVSHDVNTMKAAAEHRLAAGERIAGLFLVLQSPPTRPVAESLVLIYSVSEAEEWQDQIVYLPF